MGHFHQTMKRKQQEKLAHKIISAQGELLGVDVPYNKAFNLVAKQRGFIYLGMYRYWREDERLIVTGQPLPDGAGAAIAAKRQELVNLVAEYFPFGEDRQPPR